jgi:hypothetical protein
MNWARSVEIVNEVLGERSTRGRTICPQARRDVAIPAILRRLEAGLCAEIGVERGHFTKHLFETVPGISILAVDPWKAYRGYREHVSQERLDAFYEETVKRLDGYDVAIERDFSRRAAEKMAPESLDFVYIDANHTLPHVIGDLAVWTSRVKPGGIIAGHDYGRRTVGHVRQAVEAWVSAYGIEPWWVLAGDRSPSFLWVKK